MILSSPSESDASHEIAAGKKNPWNKRATAVYNGMARVGAVFSSSLHAAAGCTATFKTGKDKTERENN